MQKWMCLLIAAGVLLIPREGLTADAFPPIWRVKAVYKDQITGRTREPVIWEYVSAVQMDTGVKVSVKDLDGRVAFRSELLFDNALHLYHVDIFTEVTGKEKMQSRSFDPALPVIFTGTLIPSDWTNNELPWDEKSRLYKVIRKIGNTSFAESYRVSGALIDIQDAMKSNMVSNRVVDPAIMSARLLIVTVDKLEGTQAHEVLKQLWSKNFSFWLYEKTPSRESWYLIE